MYIHARHRTPWGKGPGGIRNPAPEHAGLLLRFDVGFVEVVLWFVLRALQGVFGASMGVLRSVAAGVQGSGLDSLKGLYVSMWGLCRIETMSP